MRASKSVRRWGARRGVVLLVVLAMLTLFAILGISFVIYAESAANEARLAREGEQKTAPDVDPQAAFAMFLGQFLYDVPDPDGTSAHSWGAYSALRGHSLARNMYGWNPASINDKPYCGPGRLNEVTTTWGGPFPNNYPTASYLVNYTPFVNALTPDVVMRDPERLGVRAGFSSALGTYLACNVPYTYPDQQNLYLAAIKADGTLLTPSYHRPWMFGAALTSSPSAMNSPWTSALGKYLTLRPRPADVDQNDAYPNNKFPYPDEDTGDVKNLVGFPGGNDSIWIDIDAPVQIAPDGRKFKMLVAPLVLDLDNRMNLTTAGNILGVTGSNTASASNQGLGGWEVNPAKVLSSSVSTQEWTQMFTGAKDSLTNIRVPGKYGKNGLPNGAAVAFSEWPTGYAQLDFNAITDPAGPPNYTGTLSTNFLLPGATATNSYQCFPSFPVACYNNSNSVMANGNVETTNHPLTYNVMRANATTGDDRVLGASHMPAVLLFAGTNYEAYYSDLLRLLPNNLGYVNPNTAQSAQFRTRNLVTVSSFDLDRPGVLPYVYLDGTPSDNYTYPATGTPPYPSAGGLRFPVSSTISTLMAGTTEFDTGARSLLAALGRIDLNRPLTDYPFATDPNFTTTRRFDTTNNAVVAQVNQANADRQQFAQDILNRLLIATGAQYSQDANACQWLAQLAVNIVDYIDTDDVSTVFNYTVPGTMLTGTVYGTELPRLLLNETYVQWDNNPADIGGANATRPYNVNVWVELFNPLTQMPGNAEPGTRPTGDDGLAVLQTDQGPVYQLVLNDLANSTGVTSQLTSFSNTKGDPDAATMTNGVCGNSTTAPFQPFTATQGWGATGTVAANAAPGADQVVGPSFGGFGMAPNPNNDGSVSGWYIVGPQDAEFVTATPPMNPNLFTSCKQIGNAMTYQVPLTATNLPTPSIFLRRLTNPYMPYNAATNPYITVDYMQTSQSVTLTTMVTVNVTNDDRRLNSSGALPAPPAVNQRRSWGRREPYAGMSTSVSTQLQPSIPPPNTWTINTQAMNTFFGQNTPDGSNATASTTSNNFQFPFDWLVHLDRQLISPMELRHVSAFKAHELTQRFVQPDPSAMTPGPTAVLPNQHVARWTDPSTRLSRLFEAVGTRCRSNGVAFGGRVPGRVNVNTIFDVETWRAICDAQPPNMFYAVGGTYTTTDDAVNTLFTSMMNVRTPNWNASPAALSANDRPFVGTAVGASAGVSDELTFNATTAPNRGPDYTVLAAATPPTTNTAWNAVRLLEPNDGAGNPVTPNQTGTMAQNPNFIQLPYQRAELLRKIFNNITTRSNVFAVWLTVGYFEVIQDTNALGVPIRPVQLGAEIGKSENRQIRHHMFAVVDRTNLQIWPTIDPNATTPGTPMVRQSTAITLTTVAPCTVPQTFTSGTISLVNSSGTAITSVTNPYTNFTWNLGAGTVLTFDPDTDNEETVVVQQGAMMGTFVANFYKSHAANCTVISRGNPGPWLRYDPRSDPGVVPYFTVID